MNHGSKLAIICHNDDVIGKNNHQHTSYNGNHPRRDSIHVWTLQTPTPQPESQLLKPSNPKPEAWTLKILKNPKL